MQIQILHPTRANQIKSPNQILNLDLDKLKQRLRTEWAKLDYVVIVAAIRR